MSGADGPERVRVLPAVAAWFPASISDGGAHYGELRKSGKVHAVCGLVFTPMANIYDPARPLWWRRPVDPEHGCAKCGPGA